MVLPTADLHEVVFCIFFAMLFLTVCHYVACCFMPGCMRKVLGVPESFHFRENADMRFQATAYSVLHTTWEGHLSHATLFADPLLWAVVGLNFPAILVVFWSLSLFQSMVYGRLHCWLGVALSLYHTASIGLGFLATQTCGARASAQFAMIWLLASGVLRVVGHAREAVPPGILSESTSFESTKDASCRALCWAVLVSMPCGVIAEFASGLPFRLPVVQVFFLVDHFLGCPSPAIGTWVEIAKEAEAVKASGWHASPSTSRMCEVVADIEAHPHTPLSVVTVI